MSRGGDRQKRVGLIAWRLIILAAQAVRREVVLLFVHKPVTNQQQLHP